MVAEVAPSHEARGLFETNYWSALALVRALLPSIRQRKGAVVNVSSLGAITPNPLVGHYSSSLAALQLMTETLRLELRGTGVHMLAIMPGPVETGMLAEVNEVAGAGKAMKRMPLATCRRWPGRLCARSTANSAQAYIQRRWRSCGASRHWRSGQPARP